MERIGFEQLFSALPSPHMVLDRNLCFTAANPAYLKSTNRRFEELDGRYVFDVFPNEGEGRDVLLRSLSHVLETGDADTIAYIPYDIPRPEHLGGGMERRYWTAVHTPLRDAQGDVRFILQNTVDITELVRLRAAASDPFGNSFGAAVELVQRAREAEEEIRSRRDPLDTFRRLFDEAPGIIALLQGPDHTFTFANQAYRRFVGDRHLVGRPVRDALPEVVDQGFADLLDHVFATGEPMLGFGARVLIADPASGATNETYLDFSYTAVRDPAGEITGILVQGYDRSDSVRANQRQRLLLDELNHRVKNTLSTVQSLARRSFSTAGDPQAARRVFEARILALSNAHNLLSEHHWESADLSTILQLEIEAFGSERVRADGEAVRLNPKATIALAMVFHELASNALKYGALAGQDGRVAVSWRREGDAVRLEWREDDLSSPIGSIVPGFGTRMLERIVTGELEGRLSVDFPPRGLAWTMVVPRHEIEDLGTQLRQH
ncbi:PAS domain-containing protein [Aureimonas sp. AU4]|uniref:PAS domain-containing protein n=1 Tax=Aureimonas sp. AU4 TaxID=1638163 RepID=UPI00078131CF|nr:PAS domain-containing protein [Aureimonas sp. AU4]